MTHPDIVPANFTISANGKRGIAIIRQWFDSTSPSDPAGVLAIAWGLFMPNEGPHFEQVVVSFYNRSQMPEIAHLIQNVSGIDFVFHLTTDAHHFEGKVLDFEDATGFFLRE